MSAVRWLITTETLMSWSETPSTSVKNWTTGQFSQWLLLGPAPIGRKRVSQIEKRLSNPNEVLTGFNLTRVDFWVWGEQRGPDH